MFNINLNCIYQDALNGKFNKDANNKQNTERNELRQTLENIRVEQGKIKKGRQEAINKVKELQALRRKKVNINKIVVLKLYFIINYYIIFY